MSAVLNDVPRQQAIDTPAPSTPPVQSAWEHNYYLRRLVWVTLVVLLVALLIHLLDRMAEILKPLLIACFLLYVVQPVHHWITERGLPSWLAYTVMLVLLIALFIILGALVYGALHEIQGNRLQDYEQRLDERARAALASIGVSKEVVDDFHVRHLVFSEDELNKQLSRSLQTIGSALMNLGAGVLMVLIYILFLVLERSHFMGRVAAAFGEERAAKTTKITRAINNAIGRYVAVLAIVSALQGGLSMAVLAALNVDYWFLWGVLIALFNLVPYLGGVISVPLPALLCFVQYPDEPWRGILALVLLLAIQQVVDNWVTPRMTGERLHLSPMVVLLALAFWGWLWGMVGLLLAVPLTVAIKIILMQIPETKPVAVMMSDR